MKRRDFIKMFGFFMSSPILFVKVLEQRKVVGWIRVTNKSKEAKWIGNFTPPTDSYTKLLLHIE